MVELSAPATACVRLYTYKTRFLRPCAHVQAIDRTCQMEPGPGYYKLGIVNPQEDNAPKVR